MVTIAEALEGVELEPGKIYRCNVRGLQVELRVGAPEPGSPLPDPLNEEDIMLDAWTELPDPKPTWTIRTVRGEPLMPDPLYLSPENEAPE